MPRQGGLLRNQGGVLSPFPAQLPPNAGYPHWLVDVDGDGDIDVFAASGTRLLQNQGNGVFVDVTATALGATRPAMLAAFDIDSDGDVDLFGVGSFGVNDGTGSFTNVAVAQPAQAYTLLRVGEVAADYDGDGDLELPGLPNFLRQLHAPSPPVLGASYSVELHTRPNQPTLAAIYGAFGARLAPLPPYGTVRLDPTSTQLVGMQMLTPTPTVLTWSLPNVPSLVGTALHYQAVLDDPSNGIVIGNSFRDVAQ